MIGYRHFAVFPNRSLREVLSRFGFDADACYPELIQKENHSRERINDVDELQLVMSVYVTVFVNQRSQDVSASRRHEFVNLFADQGFEKFWTVEVFEYFEDFRDLVADMQNTLPGA
jgi:hypothetical protein